MPKDKFKYKQTEFRDVDPGLQMGDKRKTPTPAFKPELNLEKGSYPTKYEEFTVNIIDSIAIKYVLFIML